MAQKGIREFHAKKMLAKYLPEFTRAVNYDGKIALVDPTTNWETLLNDSENRWISDTKLVVKPDQLFGKRGKNNLLLLNADLQAAKAWIAERMQRSVTVGQTTGVLTHFMIEPFVPHKEEYYVAIRSNREFDTIYFSLSGGINVEENWHLVKQMNIAIDKEIGDYDLKELIPADTGVSREAIISFVQGLFQLFQKLQFTYLEINPFTVVEGNKIVPLDTVARLDDTAEFECGEFWGSDLEFPSPFGRALTPEESYIAELDSKTGASLKLTVLRPEGRIWTMVAGGGASVIYADTVVDLGYKDELANYGEYSGDPSEELTHEYAKTVLDLMTRSQHTHGKVLLIGGGIANFTDVAKTFSGIIKAIKIYKDKIIENQIKIFVRRGGPNYKEGLDNMRKLGKELGISIEVFGPDTHMTGIVPMAIAALK
ncbi:MAG: ATPase [Oligoflexia bacterium]|nr:ATPase [Oligoflexia bacterium]